MAFVTDTDLAATGPGQGADMVGFRQDRTGAISRLLREKLSDFPTVLDFIPAGQHAEILSRTSTYDATPDIKRAIDQASAEGRRLHVPTGLYNITPATPLETEAGLIHTCFLLRSNMDLVGERGASLRIPNGISTDENVVPMAIFASNQPIARITLRDMTLDLNGQNNPISPNRGNHALPHKGYSLLNQPHIFISGTPGVKFTGSIAGNVLTVSSVSSGTLTTGMALTYSGAITPLIVAAFGTGSGATGTYILSSATTAPSQNMAAGFAAYADDVLIENVRFLNNPGVSCVCMAQSNTLGVGLGRRWTLRDCQFLDNGLDTVDHSCVFGWAQDVTVDSCVFQNSTPFDEVGMVTAYEVHGANTKFINNTVRNAYQGMWLSENLTAESDGILVSGNTFDGIKAVGIGVFGAGESLLPTKRITIADNIIKLNASGHPGIDLKAGIQIASPYAQRDITIRGNRIVGRQETASAGIVITTQDVAPNLGEHSYIDIDHNTSEGTVFGVFVRTTQQNGLGNVKITRNRLINPAPSEVFEFPVGVAVGFNGDFATAKPIDSLIVRNNEVVLDTVSLATVTGVRLEGHLFDLDYSDNTTRNVQVSLEEVHERCNISTRRGNFPLRYFTPEFKAGGTAITLGNGSVHGTWSMSNGRILLTARLSVGSTTIFPSGILTLDLPVASGFTGVQFIGQARIYDSSAVAFTFVNAEVDGTASLASLQVTGGTNITPIAPVALSTGDMVSIHIEYATPTA